MPRAMRQASHASRPREAAVPAPTAAITRRRSALASSAGMPTATTHCEDRTRLKPV